ncbi:hypothetical protein B0H16DRAFT_309691 [Mycena metata]|uniref:Uncharacterized protein n=1 Tax=Mycena metata TaxID=1033252 RepID=A0AAD7NNH8_9AGAR|nr:hypothetical protein B0H16DRAFT_309691 [Mycena metata]
MDSRPLRPGVRPGRRRQEKTRTKKGKDRRHGQAWTEYLYSVTEGRTRINKPVVVLVKLRKRSGPGPEELLPGSFVAIGFVLSRQPRAASETDAPALAQCWYSGIAPPKDDPPQKMAELLCISISAIKTHDHQRYAGISAKSSRIIPIRRWQIFVFAVNRMCVYGNGDPRKNVRLRSGVEEARSLRGTGRMSDVGWW